MLALSPVEVSMACMAHLGVRLTNSCSDAKRTDWVKAIHGQYGLAFAKDAGRMVYGIPEVLDT